MNKVRFALILALLVECVMWIMQGIHYLFVTGLNPFMGMVMTILFLLLVVVGVVVIIRRRKKLMARFGLQAIGAAELFIAGGFWCVFEGLRRGDSTLDIQIHDTYFVIAHTHFWFVAAIFYGLMAVVYVWVPMLNRTLGIIHFWGSFACAFLVFPLFGWHSMPRRYLDYSAWISFDEWSDWQGKLMWFFMVWLGVQLLFIFNLGYSMVWGRKIR